MKKARILKRLASMLYDLLIITSILMVYTLILVILNGGSQMNSNSIVYPLSLFIFTFIYFYISWCRLGQTVGMRAWKIKLMDENLMVPSPKRCILRFIVSIPSLVIFGLGIAWYFSSNKRITLHDRLSRTYIYDLNSKDLAK
jgi:uncharacterized RDD family membrane protein YckC